MAICCHTSRAQHMTAGQRVVCLLKEAAEASRLTAKCVLAFSPLSRSRSVSEEVLQNHVSMNVRSRSLLRLAILDILRQLFEQLHQAGVDHIPKLDTVSFKCKARHVVSRGKDFAIFGLVTFSRVPQSYIDAADF